MTADVPGASIPGIGKDSLNVTIKETGAQETVYTYGEYMRRFINDVKAKGAHPILFSLTPRNAWADKDSTIITRVNKTFGLWAKQVAEEQNVPFIDLNDITARKFEKVRQGESEIYVLYRSYPHQCFPWLKSMPNLLQTEYVRMKDWNWPII